VPDFALQAEEVYRLEIGTAFFIAFYLATMALLLALGGRGFAEIGTRGLKVRKVVDHAAPRNQQQILARQLRIDRRTDLKMKELHVEVEELREELGSHRRRLELLERAN
jgi:hypothetical protein